MGLIGPSSQPSITKDEKTQMLDTVVADRKGTPYKEAYQKKLWCQLPQTTSFETSLRTNMFLVEGLGTDRSN